MDTPTTPGDRKPTLEQLLRRGDVWRGHSQVFSPGETVATGHSELDARLLNRGWPRGSLVEVCLPEVKGCYGYFGGDWLLMTPAVKALLGSEAYMVLLNPPALPFASGLIQLGLPLDKILVVRAEGRQDFIAGFVELSRSPHCAALLAWQPEQQLSYTELRKCQLNCAEQPGLYFLLRPHRSRQQSSPAPLRLSLQLQPEALRVEIFKQKGRFHSGAVSIALPESWLPQSARRELGGTVLRPVNVPVRPVAAAVNESNIVPFNSGLRK